MTDAQIIAIAITVLAVMVGSVFNNVRIGDVNTSLSSRIGEGNASVNRRIDDLRDVLRAEFRADMTGVRADMTRLENKMDTKLDTIIAILGQLDTRVTKLEERSH